jgi:hypothetical protein
MPDFAAYDAALGNGVDVVRQIMLMICLVAMGLALDGCTKCGPIWDDWLQSPKSCRSDRF